MNADLYLIFSITIIALVTWFTRAVPFILFSNKDLPKLINYLGKVLPPAIMIVLVCYCLKNITFSNISGFLPELISCLVVAAIHIYRKNMYLSIIAGTVCYMILIRVIA